MKIEINKKSKVIYLNKKQPHKRLVQVYPAVPLERFLLVTRIAVTSPFRGLDDIGLKIIYYKGVKMSSGSNNLFSKNIQQ